MLWLVLLLNQRDLYPSTKHHNGNSIVKASLSEAEEFEIGILALILQQIGQLLIDNNLSINAKCNGENGNL